MRLIGLTGVKRAGKDTAAAHLVARHGYRRAAFADALRVEVYLALRGAAPPGPRPAYLADIDAWLAYLAAHKEAGPDAPAHWTRRLLQDWGQMRREQAGAGYWLGRVDLAPGVAIADVRMPNEVAAIRAAGGVIWRVERPGYAAGPHETERHIPRLDVDAVLANDADPQTLHRRIDALLEAL